MFEDKDLDCVFLETNMSIKKRYHMVYECIPLPKEVGDVAPIYFKVLKTVFFSGYLSVCIIICLFLENLYSNTDFEKTDSLIQLPDPFFGDTP